MSAPLLQLRYRAEFCAAYRLHNPAFDDAWNRKVYGVCFSPNNHGHNYFLDTEVEGPVDPDTGMVMDLLELQALVQEKIIRKVDHLNLNIDVPFLQGRVPTSENLLLCFWEVLAPALPAGVLLKQLSLRESRDHQVVYRGPKST
ncbi:MAG: 6-carboxytetrahydropterin synthase [Planctomycetota bacterium]|nr:MAG: 6-carboxytetrahydropterin synthase [Planctomycetota bacterium]